MSKSLFSKANEKFVETLISARLEAGLRQSELAEIVGKDQSYISNIERGQRRVDMLEFYILARAMNKDPVRVYADAIEGFPEQFEI